MDLLILGKFICSFRNISRYPFGEQYCDFSFFIEGVDNELTELFLEAFSYTGVPYVGQYDINSWHMEARRVGFSTIDRNQSVKLNMLCYKYC